MEQPPNSENQEIISAEIDQAIAQLQGELGQKAIQIRAEGSLALTRKGYEERDIVTAADLAVERTIIDWIQKQFPEHSIRGEEGENIIGSAPYEWIIDPIDGTYRFAAGFDDFGISIGLLGPDQQPVYGSIYFPARSQKGIRLHAFRGQGAYREGETIRSRENSKPLQDCMIGFDFSAQHDLREEQAQRLLIPILREARYPLIGACATAAVLNLIEGRLDGFVGAGATPYDIAGATIILKEAGFQISGLRGEPLDFSQKQIPFIASPNTDTQSALQMIVSRGSK